MRLSHILVFFFNDTATTEIYPLSLHDALPILVVVGDRRPGPGVGSAIMAWNPDVLLLHGLCGTEDRKSTRLNSSHSQISYAVFCLKKKNTSDARAVGARRLHILACLSHSSTVL